MSLYSTRRSAGKRRRKQQREALIRTLGVGLIVLATVAAARILLKRRIVAPAPAKAVNDRTKVDKLYAAGL